MRSLKGKHEVPTVIVEPLIFIAITTASEPAGRPPSRASTLRRFVPPVQYCHHVEQTVHQSVWLPILVVVS